MANALLFNRFRQAEFARNVWHISPEAGTACDALLSPEWWVHVARSLKAGDKLEILAEDRSWYAEAVVITAAASGARIAYTVAPVSLTNDAKVEEPDEYAVAWAGPHARFRVLRKADNQVLKDGFETKEQAASWARNHVKAMAA